MNVLMVLEGEFPSDERVEKEILSLQEAGFEVAIAVYTRKGLGKLQQYNNYRIFRKEISDFMYKSSAAALMHPFYFRFWYNFLNTILSREKFDIIHVHDLPLAKTCYRLAHRYGLKLVCDQHEFYSNWIVRTRHYNNFTGKIIRFLSNWKRYERRYLQKADLVVTVEDSLRHIYIKQVGVLPEKIATLPNTPSEGYFLPDKIKGDIVDRYRNRFVLFYAGGLDHLRGIDFIMEAIAALKNDINNILFLIAGKENRAFQLEPLIQKFNIKDHIDFAGWVQLKDLSSYIAASHVCLFVPKADNTEINNTIATKIYQYAAMGKPVIVSEARMMKDFVESNRIGYSVKFGDVPELCRIIKEVHSRPEIAESIKSRAIDVAAQYTWGNTSKEFLNRYLKFSDQPC